MAVDYELVYSINTASRATGNLMKVQDAHTHTHTHTEKVLHTGRAAEGTQMAGTHTYTHRRSSTLGMLLRARRWQTHTHTHTHTHKVPHTGRVLRACRWHAESQCRAAIPALFCCPMRLKAKRKQQMQLLLTSDRKQSQFHP